MSSRKHLNVACSQELCSRCGEQVYHGLSAESEWCVPFVMKKAISMQNA